VAATTRLPFGLEGAPPPEDFSGPLRYLHFGPNPNGGSNGCRARLALGRATPMGITRAFLIVHLTVFRRLGGGGEAGPPRMA